MRRHEAPSAASRAERPRAHAPDHAVEERETGAEHEAARHDMAWSLKASMEKWGGQAKTLASSPALRAILEDCGVRADKHAKK